MVNIIFLFIFIGYKNKQTESRNIFEIVHNIYSHTYNYYFNYFNCGYWREIKSWNSPSLIAVKIKIFVFASDRTRDKYDGRKKVGVSYFELTNQSSRSFLREISFPNSFTRNGQRDTRVVISPLSRFLKINSSRPSPDVYDVDPLFLILERVTGRGTRRNLGKEIRTVFGSEKSEPRPSSYR